MIQQRHHQPLKQFYFIILAALFAISAAACTNGGNNEGGKQDAHSTPHETQPAGPTEGPSAEPAPEFTADPTEKPQQPFPDDEWFIEEAWKAACAIGNALNMHPDRGSIEIWHSSGNHPTFYVELYMNDYGPRLDLHFNYSSDANGYKLVSAFCPFNRDFFKSEEEQAEWWQNFNRDMVTWRQKFENPRITVTPNDIAAYGCTETEGDEYMDAVAHLMQKKWADLFRSEPEGSVLYCYELKEGSVSFSGAEGSFCCMARFSDPAAIDEFFDGQTWFDADEGSETYGWICFAVRCKMTQQEDGSWLGELDYNISAS